MKEVLDISQCPEFVLLLQIILFVDLVWMLAWSFHDLCAPMAGWEQWLQASLWRQKCISFTQIFFLWALAAGRKSQQWYDQHGSTVVLCSHWVSEQPLVWLHLVQRRPIWYSMICEDVPRQCLKFLPLSSTFSCNGQILPAQAAQESPCMWRKAKKKWGGRTCFLREHTAVLHLLLPDTEFWGYYRGIMHTFKEIYGLYLITEPQQPGKAGQLEPNSF